MNKKWSIIKTALVLILIPLLLGGSCSIKDNEETNEKTETSTLSVFLWNVQNLFDGIDAGTEYDEFKNDAGWNESKYKARILSFSQAIESYFNKNAPSVIGLVEVENLQVLEDISCSTLAKYGYNWLFFGSMPGMSLGTGVLSRYPLNETKVHSITLIGETIPRPVLEFHIEAEGEELVFFLCHWKSKLGNDEATEALRRAAAKVIKRRCAEIHLENPGLPVIVMGDLNENHDEFYRISGAMVTALLPDDQWAGKLAVSENISDFLILSGEKPPKTNNFNSNTAVFYSPWRNELTDGSYYYKNNWETIDHFLLSEGFFDNQGWEYETCKVLNQPPFSSSSGYPEPYNLRNGLGMSDHLPLMLYLTRK